MSAVLPFLRPTNPTQRQQAREESMRYDVRCSLPGIAPLRVAQAQAMALDILRRRPYQDALRIAVDWARNPVDPKPPLAA